MYPNTSGLWSGGGEFTDWGGLGSLVNVGLDIYRSFNEPRQRGPRQRQNGGLFNIPGWDLQSPLKREGTNGECAAHDSPFYVSGTGTRVTPQPFCTENPGSGKTQWFVPARIKGFEMTHVRKPRRRCGCCTRKR